jgi:hypothetical protein
MAFLFGLLVGLLLSITLLCVGVWLLVRGNKAAAAHFLHGVALVLKPKEPRPEAAAPVQQKARLV